MVETQCNCKTSIGTGFFGIDIRNDGITGLYTFMISLMDEECSTSFDVKDGDTEYQFNTIESLYSFISDEKFSFNKKNKSIRCYMRNKESNSSLSVTLGTTSNFLYLSSDDRFWVQNTREKIEKYLNTKKHFTGFSNIKMSFAFMVLMVLMVSLSILSTVFPTYLILTTQFILAILFGLNIVKPFIKFNKI